MDRDEQPFLGHPDGCATGVCTLEKPATELVSGGSAGPEGVEGPSSPVPTQSETEPGDRGAEDRAGATVDPVRVIEALLFAADTPLSAARLAELCGMIAARDVPGLVAALNEQYAAAGLAFRVEEIARGYQMMTLPAYQPWLARLDRQRSQMRLSPAALETLAIIAYKQPIIRADIEAIRGVACGEVLNRLREMGLVRILGRAEIIGRPLLYGTTRKFLDVFGLADLDDLPPMESFSLRRATAGGTELPPPEPAASAVPVAVGI
jgi:segregation and condensation protein B